MKNWENLLSEKEWPLAVESVPSIKLPIHNKSVCVGNDKLSLELNSKNEGDLLILYDIIDHLDDPVSFLQKQLIRKIFIRCHPWCSRHGSHHYEKINKAFIHLIIPPSDLMKIAGIGKKTTKVIDPLVEYEKWFSLSGYNVLTRVIHRKPIEPWIINNFSKEICSNFTLFGVMNNLIRNSIEYIDYCIER